MTTLVRWRPVRSLSPWRCMSAWSNGWLTPHWDSHVMMPVDIEEKKDAFVIKTSVPGFTPDEINISVEKGVLTIHAERQGETEEKREGYYLAERYQGSVERRFCLPENVNDDEIEADLEHGVLTLTLPKVEEPEPLKIEVKAA